MDTLERGFYGSRKLSTDCSCRARLPRWPSSTNSARLHSRFTDLEDKPETAVEDREPLDE